MQLLVFLACVSTLAQAQVDCGAQSSVNAYPTPVDPRHHPVGKPLPRRAEFNQPIDCGNGVWFFDLNHNASPDPGEPRLYGPQRMIGCSSCHADSPDATTQAAASVSLRQDASVLCLVCHSL
ncbi:MAG: hypothetical protein ABIQ90_13215 [Polaromonas sp.]